MKNQRNFVNITGTIKHIICSICQEIFDEPIRLFCGHTFCKACIINFKKYTGNCPICRKELILKCSCSCCNELNTFSSKDLIIQNIINDLEVFCNNQGCPWTGPLNDLENHSKNCVFDEKAVPDFLKPFIEDRNKIKENNRKKIMDENFSDNKQNFNTNSSLNQRLYSKNPKLLEKANNNSFNKKRDSLFEILSSCENDNNNLYEEEKDQIVSKKQANRKSHNLSINNTIIKEASNEIDGLFLVNFGEKENRLNLLDLNFSKGWEILDMKGEPIEIEEHKIKLNFMKINVSEDGIEIINCNKVNQHPIKINYDENTNEIINNENLSPSQRERKIINFPENIDIQSVFDKLSQMIEIHKKIKQTKIREEEEKRLKRLKMEKEEEEIAKKLSKEVYEFEKKTNKSIFALPNSQRVRKNEELVNKMEKLVADKRKKKK